MVTKLRPKCPKIKDVFLQRNYKNVNWSILCRNTSTISTELHLQFLFYTQSRFFFNTKNTKLKLLVLCDIDSVFMLKR